MKAFSFCLVCFLALSSFAQKKNFGMEPTDLRPGTLHQGDLFTVKMVPGDKEISFFVVGKKSGSFKIDKMTMEAIFESGGETKRVTLMQKGKAFVLPSQLGKDLDLEVKGETAGETDKLHIKLKP